MPSTQSDRPADTMPQPFPRSSESLAFERIWTAAKGEAAFPARSAIELKSFAKFASQMAIIEPHPTALSLPFRLCGSGFFDIIGFDLTGMDYLDLVNPEIKEGAYRSVMACLRQPCGLWQRTPAQTDGGAEYFFEYTILPLAKNAPDADHIIILVTRETRSGEKPTVKRIEHSTVWQWIDLGFGVPDLVFPT